MGLEESILQQVVLEGPVACNGLLKDRHAIVTMPDGTKRRTYARIFIRQTVLEVARNYARNITGKEMYDPTDPDTIAEMDRLEGGMDEGGLALFEAIVAGAFLEGGMYCAKDETRRAEFLKLDEKCNDYGKQD